MSRLAVVLLNELRTVLYLQPGTLPRGSFGGSALQIFLCLPKFVVPRKCLCSLFQTHNKTTVFPP